MSHRSTHPARFTWQIAAAVLLVLAVLSIAIPTVRASLSAWLGLSVAPSNQMPAEAVTLIAVTPATPTAAATLPLASATPGAAAAQPPTATAVPPAAPSQLPAEISQLSPQAGWAVLAPIRLPTGYKFQSAYFDTNQRIVMLTYLVTRPLPGAKDPSLTASKSITVLEALKNDVVPLQIAPAASVSDVQVSGQPAAFVIGAWDAQFVADAKDPNGGKMVSTWRNDLQVKNLYWQVGQVYLVIVTDDEAVSQPEMIDMAASVVR